jgi:hypothetical protein
VFAITIIIRAGRLSEAGENPVEPDYGATQHLIFESVLLPRKIYN